MMHSKAEINCIYCAAVRIYIYEDLIYNYNSYVLFKKLCISNKKVKKLKKYVYIIYIDV